MKARIQRSFIVSYFMIACALLAPVCAHARSPANSGSAAAPTQDILLLAGGALPLCSSINTQHCVGTPPNGRSNAPERFIAAGDGQRLREVVDFNASKSADAQAIYRHFVAMAIAAHRMRTGKTVLRPRIGILTSAASDPFDPVDFYLSAFAQAGADPQWLPLDPAVRFSFGSDCSKLAGVRTALTGEPDRAAIYPDLANTQRAFCLDRASLSKILANLDGLFFNGGDQSLSKATWFDGVQPIGEFAVLQARIKAQTLAIGGTSAGTAVMSQAAMITNGTSAVALIRGAKAVPPPPIDCTRKRSCPKGLVEDELTYEPSGGLGLFTLGILDTHFAARSRQGRLARLLLDSKTRFGFGVDETTALIVAQAPAGTRGSVRLRAIGAGSVWIFDARGANDAVQLSKRARLLKAGAELTWPP